MAALRVLYAGSPEASARTLELLLAEAAPRGFEICGALSNPPSARGRHKTPEATAVAALAERNGLPVFTPEHLDASCRVEIAAVRPDILVCFAYGRIFGPKFMALFPYGGLNLHPSALPKYRGCTPVNAAILNRDAATAFCVQTISLAMDEGDIVAEHAVPLTGKETAGTLLDAAAEQGAALLATVLQTVARTKQRPQGRMQTGAASYTTVITKENAKIDWAKSAEEIDAAVRAYSPTPGAWTTENGAALKIIAGHAVSAECGPAKEAHTDAGATKNTAAPPCGTVCGINKTEGILICCGRGLYAVTQLQRQGKKAAGFKEFMNGARSFVGTVLGR